MIYLRKFVMYIRILIFFASNCNIYAGLKNVLLCRDRNTIIYFNVKDTEITPNLVIPRRF